MKKLLILSAAVIIATSTFAQDKLADEARDENNKVEHIMELVDVDRSTAEKAATLLDEFKGIKKEAREKHMDEKKALKGKIEEMGDDEIEKLHRQRFEDQRAMIDLEETYYNKMLELMPATEVEKLLKESREHARKKMRAQRMQRKGGSQQKLRE